jgi:hypothetical protein
VSFDPRTGLSPFGGGDFASTLSQVATAVGSSFQYDQEQKKSQIKQMLETAKQFGVPGIRKLYSDPMFTSLAKSINLNLPELPEPSADELKGTRSQEALKELDRRMKAGEDPYKTRQDVSVRYPDVAKELGISIEPTGGTTAALVNAVSKLDPDQFLAAMNIAYANIGGVDNLPAAEKAYAALGMSRAVQDKAQSLRDKHNLMVQQAGLTGARKDEINKLLDAKYEQLKARTEELRATGQLRLMQAEFERWHAEVERDFGPAIAKAKVAQLATSSTLNTARAYHETQLGIIKQLEADADRALGLLGKGSKSVKLYTDSLNKLVRAEQAQLNRWLIERDKLADQLASGAISKEEHAQFKTQIDEDIKNMREALRADSEEYRRVVHGGPSERYDPGAVSKPTFTTYNYPKDFTGTKIQAEQLYNKIITVQPEQWFSEWQNARRDKRFKDVPIQVWHELTMALMSEFKRLRPNMEWGPNPVK